MACYNIMYDMRIIGATESSFLEKWGNTIEYHMNEPVSAWSVLTKAVSLNWIKVIKLLIERGVNINAEDHCHDTALSEAVTHNRIEIIKILLKNNVNVAKNNYLAIKRIGGLTEHEQINIIKHFIRYNVTVDMLISHISDIDNMTRRFLHTERLIQVTLIFHHLPQYIILWITDWLEGADSLTEHQKIETIEGVLKNVKNKDNALIT